ncbi:hypothetical protein ABZ086_35845, partial [Streptomyces halstedii]
MSAQAASATGPYRRTPLAPFTAAVTGVGLVTAAGTGVDATWRGVTESLTPSVGPRPELDGLPCDFFYSVTDCDPRGSPRNRRGEHGFPFVRSESPSCTNSPHTPSPTP